MNKAETGRMARSVDAGVAPHVPMMASQTERIMQFTSNKKSLRDAVARVNAIVPERIGWLGPFGHSD